MRRRGFSRAEKKAFEAQFWDTPGPEFRVAALEEFLPLGADLDADNACRGYPMLDWLLIADTMADCVRALGATTTLRERSTFGEQRGLRGPALSAYEMLWCDAILASPDQWTNGRHRAALMCAAGAKFCALEVPHYDSDE